MSHKRYTTSDVSRFFEDPRGAYRRKHGKECPTTLSTGDKKSEIKELREKHCFSRLSYIRT